MSKLHRLVPLVVAVSASLAQAQALTNDNLFVVKPEGTAETAVHKPGRIPWCEGKFTGEAWDPHRILRQINGQADFEPDTNWELGLEHMCQFADDPFWQRQATYIVQAAMNADPDKDQDGVVARLKRLIAASQKARANAGREPTDEERFAFADMHLQPVAAERGVDTAKITGAVPWCDGVKVSEKWDSGRIARTASGRDGIVEGALHLCQRPNDPTWKQKAGFLLQGWMNWTKQTQTEAVASMRVRIQMDKVAAEREALCKTLAPGGELAGAGKAYALAKQKFFGCYDDRFGETWQGNLHFVSDETGYYLDGSDAVDSEIARMYWLFASTSTPRADLPANSADDNKQLLAYAAVATEMAHFDEKAAAAEVPGDYTRVVINESIATLRWRKKLYDAATDKLIASDAVYGTILRDAAKQSSAAWTKLIAPWKPELDRALAFEKKLAQSSRSAVAGCSKDFDGVVEKVLRSYKTKDYAQLIAKLADDPVASLLLSRIALCYGIDKVPGSGVVAGLARTGRGIRGRRGFAYYAIVDKLSEVRKDRPRLLLEHASFWNPTAGGQSDRELTSDIQLAGGVPLDPNGVESRGVVGKVSKTADGIRVEFKRISRTEPEIECKETDRIDRIDLNGNISYRSNCWQTGKMVKVDLTPAPQDVPARYATGIKPGVFAAIDRGGAVPYVKAKPDDKAITAFFGYAL